MAAVAHLSDTASTSNALSYVSGSFTPTDGDLLVVSIVASGTTDVTPTLTESAGGGTYTLVETLVWNGTSSHVYVFIRDQLVGASPPARTLTLTLPADAATGAAFSVERVTGMTNAGTAAVQQSKSIKGSSGNTPTVTMDAAINTANPVILAAVLNDNTIDLTEPTGFTQLIRTTYANPATSLETSSADSGITATTITWGTTPATSWGVAAVELLPGGGGGSSLTKDLADTVTLADALANDVGAAKADTVTLTDAFDRAVEFFRDLGDTATLADALSKAADITAADSVTLSDNFTSAFVLLLELADTVTLSDAVAKDVDLAKADTVSAADSFARTVAFAKALADTVALLDHANPEYSQGARDWILRLADEVTLTDVFPHLMDPRLKRSIEADWRRARRRDRRRI